MTTLQNRPNTAVSRIDVQNGVVSRRLRAGQRRRKDRRPSSRVPAAAEVPVVWVQHTSENLPEGSEQWKIVPELSPDEREPLYRSGIRTRSRRRRSRRSSTISPSGDSSSSARRPTDASARRCTARSCAATTRRSSAMRTRPRTLAVGRAVAGSGHRAHESLLGQPRGTRADRRDRRGQGVDFGAS